MPPLQTPESEPVQAVFVDAAGTLIRLRESVGAGYAKVARQFGLELPVAALDEAFAAHFRGMPPLNTGTPPSDDGKSWWRALVDRILDSPEIPEFPADCREDYFEALYAHYARPGQWEAYPDALPILESLGRSPGLKTGILSNFDKRLHGILEGLGLRPHLEHLIISSEVGFSKPHSAIFEHAWRQAASSPAACLHVGDDPEADWEGARAAGMKAIRFDRERGSLREALAGLLEP